MNILHIASTYPPAIGGTATSTPALAKELIKKGNRAVVLTRDARGYPPYEILEGIPTYRSWRMPGEFYFPPVAMAKSIAMGLKARSVIEKEKIDLIHTHDINVSAIAGILGSKFKKIKKVTKFPGDLAWELLSLIRWKGRTPEEFFENQDYLVGTLERLQKWICENYDAILAPSKYMAKTLVKYSGVDESKVHVVYNAIEVAPFSPDEIGRIRKHLLGDNKRLILSACRMVSWKGLEYLIDAFRELPENYVLALAGDGPLKKDLESRYGGANIKFLGKIPHGKIQKYLRASDLFVLPSIYEPSALALLDCLATQTPVIATNVGGTPEIIMHKKTGLLVKPKDSKSISDSITILLKDKEFYNIIKKNQMVDLSQFTWDTKIRDYVRIYEMVLNS